MRLDIVHIFCLLKCIGKLSESSFLVLDWADSPMTSQSWVGSLFGIPICVHITHSHKGFACQANEFSHYMLLASFLILNKYG